MGLRVRGGGVINITNFSYGESDLRGEGGGGWGVINITNFSYGEWDLGVGRGGGGVINITNFFYGESDLRGRGRGGASSTSPTSPTVSRT